MQFLADLEALLQTRAAERPEGSYTAKLFEGGLDRILKKVGEEAGEVIIAAKNGDSTEIIHECADLIFHIQVMLVACGRSIREVEAELIKRHQP